MAVGSPWVPTMMAGPRVEGGPGGEGARLRGWPGAWAASTIHAVVPLGLTATALGFDCVPPTVGMLTVLVTAPVAVDTICTWCAAPSATTSLVPSGVTCNALGSSPTAPLRVTVAAA